MTDFLFLLALQSTDKISDSEINLVTQVWMRAQSDIHLHRNSSCRLLSKFVSGSKASIFVRKTLQVRLRDRNMLCMFQARKVGPAFFDEDDDLLPDLAACLNCHTFSKSSANATENLLAASAYIWPSQSAKSSESVNSRLASSRSPAV